MAKKILLADDSITIQKVISITFSNEDYELIMAGDGEEALRKAREARPSLIMVDVGMPGRNGYDVCEAVKNDPELSGTPVMLLAGTFEPLDGDRAAQVGADDHIVKPFESQELLDKVNRLVAAAGPSGGETPAEAPAEAGTQSPSAAPGEEGFDVSDEMWEEGDFLGFSEEFEESPPAVPGPAEAAPGAGAEETSPPSGDDLEFLDENLFDTPEEESTPGPSEAAGEPEFVDLEFGPEELKEEPGEDELKPFGAEPVEEAPEVETTTGDLPSFEGTFGGDAFEEAPASWGEAEEEAPGFAPVSDEPETPGEPVFGEAAIGEPFGTEAAEETPAELETPTPAAEPQAAEPQAPEPAAEEPLQVVQEVSEEVEEAARTVEERAVAGVEEKVGEALEGRVDVPRDQVEEIVSRVAREVVREVAWEVVPELAEELIAEELNRIRQAFAKAR